MLSQVLSADREVFVYCSANCKDIRPNATGVGPLDAMLSQALTDYNTTFHLLPLLASSSATPAKNTVAVEPPPQRPADFVRRPKSKGKGKGKSASKSNASFAPRGFVGCVGRDQRGRPICFDFNIKGCSKAAAGSTCPNGRRVCFKSMCFKVHAFHEAHASEMPSQEWQTANAKVRESIFQAPSVSAQRAIVLELFAGTAGVTAAFRRRNLHNCIAIDKLLHKFPHARIIQLDLTVRSVQDMVHTWVAKPETVAVFLAPPCGTASLAREVPIDDMTDAPKLAHCP